MASKWLLSQKSPKKIFVKLHADTWQTPLPVKAWRGSVCGLVSIICPESNSGVKGNRTARVISLGTGPPLHHLNKIWVTVYTCRIYIYPRPLGTDPDSRPKIMELSWICWRMRLPSNAETPTTHESETSTHLQFHPSLLKIPKWMPSF